MIFLSFVFDLRSNLYLLLFILIRIALGYSTFFLDLLFMLVLLFIHFNISHIFYTFVEPDLIILAIINWLWSCRLFYFLSLFNWFIYKSRRKYVLIIIILFFTILECLLRISLNSFSLILFILLKLIISTLHICSIDYIFSIWLVFEIHIFWGRGVFTVLLWWSFFRLLRLVRYIWRKRVRWRIRLIEFILLISTRKLAKIF